MVPMIAVTSRFLTPNMPIFRSRPRILSTRPSNIMAEELTVIELTNRYAEDDLLRRAVATAVQAFVSASIDISESVGRGALAGITGRSQAMQNADGDVQKDLDLRADEIIRGALKSTPYTALASEEADQPEFGDPSALISIAYDPLDGSSNIETNTAVGTIFSILPGHSLGAPFSRPGSEQLAAGFVVYGPQTSLVLTLGDGVRIFTLDRSERTYKLIRERVEIPADSMEYAINASNHRHWEQPIRNFVEECWCRRSSRQRLQYALDSFVGRRSVSYLDTWRGLPLPFGCAQRLR
jgi:fructose-1,6-bisphosphatase I